MLLYECLCKSRADQVGGGEWGGRGFLGVRPIYELDKYINVVKVISVDPNAYLIYRNSLV